MASSNTLHQLADALLDLEKTLRDATLWADTVPTVKQLTSTTPFACDVMPLQQWLQWIFIPKMKYLLEQDAPLPKALNITALAEETIAKLPEDTYAVMQSIKNIDTLFE